MITLGINAAFHDSAAALVIDGVVVAAAEEERFSRIKHGKRPLPFSAWELPFNAADSCLAQAGVTVAELDHVAYSFDPAEFLGTRGVASTAQLVEAVLGSGRVDAGASAYGSKWDPLFATYVLDAPNQFAGGAPHHLRRRLALDDPRTPPYRWHFVNHHACHQASAFLAAPFARCAVMTLDGRGERATTTYGTYDAQRGYRGLGAVTMPHSFGLLYEQVTSHLGFLHSSDEYKVMALAALGRPTWREVLRGHVHLEADGGYSIAPLDMERLFGPKREPGSALLQRHFDLAASLQTVLEESVLEIARWLREASGERRLAMAGGVALNCLMNSRLRDSGIFDEVWVQPAAGDAGTALGAALWVDGRERLGAAPGTTAAAAFAATSGATACATTGATIGATKAATTSAAPATADSGASADAVRFAPRVWHMQHVYLGPEYSDDEIERTLRWAKLRYRRFHSTNELAAAAAALLADNLVLGWFQGPMEFGPRALGARSIIASPIDPGMQARLNELKDREDFRPVAPAVPQEHLAEWFAPAAANGGASPFMLFVYDVAPEQAARIPSACHADRTARVQTVDAATNPRFHATLKAFGQLTGVPVLVNTSFNVRGEPIVCRPRHAIEAFYSTLLDALVIGSFIVEKAR